jgi:hypothetical protein
LWGFKNKFFRIIFGTKIAEVSEVFKVLHNGYHGNWHRLT